VDGERKGTEGEGHVYQNETVVISIIATQIQRRDYVLGWSLIRRRASGMIFLTQNSPFVEFSRDPKIIQKFSRKCANIKQQSSYLLIVRV
jgi:hypothetical protein